MEAWIKSLCRVIKEGVTSFKSDGIILSFNNLIEDFGN